MGGSSGNTLKGNSGGHVAVQVKSELLTPGFPDK